MATKTIAWATGSGNITLTYTGQGNGSISVSSSENDSFDDRSQSVNIVTTKGAPEQAVSVLVKQKGKTYPVGQVFNFDYTGSVQQVTLPKGKYKLQCWGAQGGNVTGTYAVNGSKGGYSEGIITLSKTTILYIFVGGQGTSYTSSPSQTDKTVINGGWNGGGGAVRTSLYNSGGIYGRSFPRGGGGGTDIALVTSAMSYSSGRTTRDSASLLSRIIVAGGGAGASARYTVNTISNTTTTETDYAIVNIYYRGQTITDYGNIRLYYYPEAGMPVLETGKTYKVTCSETCGRIVLCNRDPGYFSERKIISNGETVSITSSMGNITHVLVDGQDLTNNAVLDIKVVVVDTTTTTETSSGKSNTSMQGGGTKGKGQYPGTQTSSGAGGGAFGLGATQNLSTYRYSGGAGGGGWYGGGKSQSDTNENYINYAGGGSGFVNTSANASSRPSGYTGLQLDSGTTKDGSTSFESTSGGTETGHSGNGYARITVLA